MGKSRKEQHTAAYIPHIDSQFQQSWPLGNSRLRLVLSAFAQLCEPANSYL